VNVVSPGRIDAPDDPPERIAAYAGNRPVERIPLRRAGAPEDIADAVAAICGSDMRYVTGQTIHATGGFYMG
jgi:3-oxoacyl-[acyl-carrier protein] reductase